MPDVDDEDVPPSPQAAPAIPMDRLAKVYRKMQAELQRLTAEYDQKAEEIKRQQEIVKNALKDQMLVMGVNSVRTDNGTVVLSTKTRYNTQDWDSFKEFIKEHDAIDLLEKRISQGNMAAFLADNPGAVPAGLNSYTEYQISVRKPSA